MAQEWHTIQIKHIKTEVLLLSKGDVNKGDTIPNY